MNLVNVDQGSQTRDLQANMQPTNYFSMVRGRSIFVTDIFLKLGNLSLTRDHISFQRMIEYTLIFELLLIPYLNAENYYHRHHVVPPARISLTLSRHFSLSFIAFGRSSELHPVSSHSCCMYV